MAEEDNHELCIIRRPALTTDNLSISRYKLIISRVPRIIGNLGGGENNKLIENDIASVCGTTLLHGRELVADRVAANALFGQFDAPRGLMLSEGDVRRPRWRMRGAFWGCWDAEMGGNGHRRRRFRAGFAIIESECRRAQQEIRARSVLYAEVVATATSAIAYIVILGCMCGAHGTQSVNGRNYIDDNSIGCGRGPLKRWIFFGNLYGTIEINKYEESRGSTVFWRNAKKCRLNV